MKIAQADCTFPELKGGFAQRTGRGRGTSARIAIARAFADALKQNKKKQFHSIKAMITIITEAPKDVPVEEKIQ